MHRHAPITSPVVSNVKLTHDDVHVNLIETQAMLLPVQVLPDNKLPGEVLPAPALMQPAAAGSEKAVASKPHSKFSLGDAGQLALTFFNKITGSQIAIQRTLNDSGQLERYAIVSPDFALVSSQY
jgi:hypothetical protein